MGCSGWVYRHWKDAFYPVGLRQADWFRHYASVFGTVEINNSFYRTPTEGMFQEWGRQAPEGFCYAIKVNRSITQFYKLGAASFPLFDEFVRRAGAARSSLGPLLLQLPPSLGRNDERLDAFLSRPSVASHPLAVEFRKADWFTEEVYGILRARGVALALSDLRDLPVPQVATAPWMYVRLHGSSGQYQGSYGDQDLRRWAGRIRDLGSAAYVYFNNDIGGAAPRDALRLRALLLEGTPNGQGSP